MEGIKRVEMVAVQAKCLPYRLKFQHKSVKSVFFLFQGSMSYDLEMHTIKNCILIDEWEHNLHRKKDCLSALNHEQQCCPPFTIYIKNFLVPSPGDWSSWYYVKKLLVDVPTDSPLLSLIPEQGPFHVTLNAHETAVELHRFFFAELHKHLFNSAMPEKPKPDRIAVLVAAFLGWLMLRSKVLTLFKLCKDLEYVSLLYLMEEVILMLFFHYPVISRSSNLDNCLQTNG